MHRWSRGVFAVAMTEPRTRRADGDFNITNQTKIKQIKQINQSARRVFARHTRAAIAPTRTDALAHYSTTRRTERTARARRRRDPDAVSVDG